jgi:hypothetical protein
MKHRFLLALAIALLPVAPAFAADDDDGGYVDEAPVQTPAMPNLDQLKNVDTSKLGVSGGLGGMDMGQAIRLVRIGQALKAKKPVSPEDIAFLRQALQKMGAADSTHASSMQQLDKLLEKLQARTAAPTEEDEMMRDFADGADMDDIPTGDD